MEYLYLSPIAFNACKQLLAEFSTVVGNWKRSRVKGPIRTTADSRPAGLFNIKLADAPRSEAPAYRKAA